jgi:hypothetical protein
MGILGDLNEYKPNADVGSARTDQGKTARLEPRPDQGQINVGEIPLNNASEPLGEAAQSGRSGGPGRPRETRHTVSERARFPGRLGPVQEPRHSTTALWSAVTLLSLALICVVGYIYLALRQNNISLSQLPGPQPVLAALGGRMNSAEASLRDLATKWNGLAERIDKLDHKLSSTLAVARRQTQERIAQAEARLRTRMDSQARMTDARLARVESEQADQRAQLAQVQDQLQKQNSAQQEVAGLRQEMAGQRSSTGRELAGLRDQVDRGRSGLEALRHEFDRQRLDFEAAKNSTVTLAPDVSLTVVRTDVRYQRFAGYISLTTEGRTLWLPNGGANESVDFYSKRANHPYDLVVTTISKRGVVGYLLLPAGGGQFGPESARNRTGVFGAAGGR